MKGVVNLGSVRIDPFFEKQPPLRFVEELKQPVHREKPAWFTTKDPGDGEVSVTGAYLVKEFSDTDGLLETAYADFDRFLQLYTIAGDRYPIRIVYEDTPVFEAYRLRITTQECVVGAADTEGIRRALIYLEDELCRRSGPVLTVGEIYRQPVIRERITRGFFSPTNRPPKNIDELMDDVDYYPDEYLNRLAHDGTNGLWIYTYFHDLLTTDTIPEHGKDAAVRIAKLKRVVAKCKRYGVKVWIFGVEPYALAPDVAAKHPDAVGGVGWNGRYTVCTYSEEGAAYCVELTRRLMEQVPDLGGIIDITFGERPSSCVNSTAFCQCPRCRQHSRGEALAHTVNLLKEGMRQAGSKADFVSWTYGHRESPREEIEEYVRLAPDDVMLMENFEDAGFPTQLGKTRQATDYWLSYVGPSDMYANAAQTAQKEGKHLFAKMQVCCSHELATVPYIPVPGILFDKYTAAHRFGVEGVMQCWYFGNYPSLMSKAAGELSFAGDFSDKDAFLTHLAGIYCGDRAPDLVSAWKRFEEGYTHYPINIMFSYYGPMHDGVVWDLALEPTDTCLPRSWQLPDKPDGDRIGECLQSGHTLEEAITLTDYMREAWHEGVALLPDTTPVEQRTVAQALDVLLASGNNILHFYHLREQLAYAANDAAALLDAMESIVEEEMTHSAVMIDLCYTDRRLGYHSEAEGFKFFPEKLQERIRSLAILKADSFTRVRNALAHVHKPLTWYDGDIDSGYRMGKGDQTTASFVRVGDSATFRVAYDAEHLYVELQGSANVRYCLNFEYRLLWPSPGIVINNGVVGLSECAVSHQSMWGDKITQELAKYHLLHNDPATGHYVLAIDRQAVGWTEDRPLRMALTVNGVPWMADDQPVRTLGKFDASPGDFGWLMP